MTRSDVPENLSPIYKYIEFKGKKGKFVYWDKEKEENVEVKTPFKFLVLDELHTVKGFNNTDDIGIYSNEVKNLEEQELVVKTHKGREINRGLYDDIKKDLQGGKYAKAIYAYSPRFDETVHIVLTGVALSMYIERGFKNKTIIAKVEEEKRRTGDNEYFAPFFEQGEYTQEEVEKATEAEEEIKQYIENKLNKSPEEQEETTEEPKQEPSQVEDGLNDDEDLPF